MRSILKNIKYVLQNFVIPQRHHLIFIQRIFTEHLLYARYYARHWECKDQWSTGPALRGFTFQAEIQAPNPKICNASLRVTNDRKEIKCVGTSEDEKSAYNWDMKTRGLICKDQERGSILGRYMTIFKSPNTGKLRSGEGSKCFRPQAV